MPVQLLLIDANIGFIVRLKQALEDQEYEVRTVGRPKAALAALSQSQFDVAVIDLGFEDIADLVATVRNYQPHLPIVFSGSSVNDPEKVSMYHGQAYIHKPYVARDLIPVIELARQQLRASRHHPDVPSPKPQSAIDLQIFESEPPIDEGATIGDIFSALSGTEIEVDLMNEVEGGGEQIQQPIPPDTLPEAVSRPIQAATAITEPETDSDDSPAAKVLRLSNDEEILDTMLIKTQRGDIQPLPSWTNDYSADEMARIDAVLGNVHGIPPFETPPYTTITQPFSLPEIDLLPDPEDSSRTPPHLMPSINPELLEALANAENLDDPHLQAVLKNIASVPPEEELLVAATLDEVTQAMGVVLDETDDDLAEMADDEKALDAEAVEELLVEIDVLAYAALQLTQQSLESSALGTLLTYNHHPVARTGTFTDYTWSDILAALQEAWQREGSSRTRILYRNTNELGQIMLFSTQSVDDLVLTMIFSADTPLRIIRRQAARLTDALVRVPEGVEESAPPVESSPSLPETSSDIIEAPAAVTIPSRQTDLRPPEALQEAMAADVLSIEKPKREAGSYMGYACLWLLKEDYHALSQELGEAIPRWLVRVSDANDWDVMASEIGDGWINVHLEIPLKAVPGQVIQTLREELQGYIADALGQPLPDGSIWTSAYSVTTPGRLLSRREIERFVKFQREQAI